MNGAFDVDCPRTPDGGDADAKGGGKQASAAPPSQPSNNSRPPVRSAASSRPRGPTTASRTTPRTAGRKTAGPFSPRYHPRKTASSSKRANVGLEPEEYIAPATQHMPPRPPGPPPGPPASDLFLSPPTTRARAHSTEAFGGNPFGNDKDVGGGGSAGNRVRSNSGSWWREEIVDEGDDKGVAMDQYYGLNARQKYDLYGGPHPPPPSSSSNAATEAAAAAATAAASTNPFDAEQGGGLPAQQPQKQNANLDSDIYQQAAAGRNAGYYNTADNIVANNAASNGGAAVVDDYSFSNVNLTSPVEGNNPASPPTSPYAAHSKTANIRDSLAQKWYGLFAKPARNPSHLPPNMTSQTNIAPRSAHGLHSLPCDQPFPNRGEWHAKSPGVTFDCFHPHSHSRKRHGYWNAMSPGKKIALGTVWVAFVCIIFGVTISELKKANANNNNGGEEGTQAQGMGNGVQLAPPVPDADPTMEPTPWPETMAPTDVPTTSPTRHPTRMPVTSPPTAQGNIAGYIAIHGKAYDATPHPTRSPTTASPTKSPTPPPTVAPTTDAPSAAPSIEVQAVQTATVTCEDADGAYKNHLEVPNLKTCVWLANGREGYTDRKDKNCGGVPVVDDAGATVVYPTSELGRMCQQTCALYNGCASASAGAAGGDAIGDYLTPRNGSGGGGNRPDQQGFFLNHLFNPKTCGWLYNDKPGLTDRKEKNCGSANYPITDLGRACPTTCAPYNRGVADASVGKVAVAGGHVVRSYSTPSYSYSVSSHAGNASTECIDGEGEYADQKHAVQPCSWLAGGGHANSARHRQEKNCGSAVHGITELGRECPWSCRAYNDCGS